MAKVKIGDFLHRIKRPITLNTNDEYRLVTIKMHHKGVILRGLKKGADIKSKMYEVKEGDFILSGIDARNGAFGIVSQELDGAIVTNDFWYFKFDEEIIDKHFFLELTSTIWFDEICRLGSDGTTQRIRLQKDKFFNQEINLPPLEEQQDFISKFKSSKTINTNISNEIESQQTLLKKLRQSILQDAIEGKLTASWREQNPDVESASVLLEKIKAEKEQLVKEKKIKKQKLLPPINEDQIPFDIPDSWKWCRLGDIYNFIDYRGKTPHKIDSGIRLITAKNVKSGYLSIEPEDFISIEEYEERMTRGFPKKGDILFTTEAPLGNVALLNLDEIISTGQRLITFQSYSDSLNNNLVLHFLLTKFFQQYLVENSTGVTAKGIKSSRLISLLIPLPSLQEQKEIVKKIENLFKICDELEEQINSSRVNSEMLMQAVLKEAFENNDE